MSTSTRKTATPKKATPKVYAKKATPPAAPPQSADPYAPTAWATFDREFVTPSGQRCRLKKLGLTDLVESGLQDKLNTLQGVVNKKMGAAKGQPPKDLDPQKLLKDKNTMSSFMSLVDDILVLSVTAPHIKHVPDNPGLREEGQVYTDMVDLMDKVAIFNESVGGLQALAAFRQ